MKRLSGVAVAVTVACLALFVSLGVLGYFIVDSANEAKAAKAQASKACKRSKAFGPDFYAHLESFNGTPHALSPKTLTFFKVTIPKTCP